MLLILVIYATTGERRGYDALFFCCFCYAAMDGDTSVVDILLTSLRRHADTLTPFRAAAARCRRFSFLRRHAAIITPLLPPCHADTC